MLDASNPAWSRRSRSATRLVSPRTRQPAAIRVPIVITQRPALSLQLSTGGLRNSAPA
jgi:hypothetical protein